MRIGINTSKANSFIRIDINLSKFNSFVRIDINSMSNFHSFIRTSKCYKVSRAKRIDVQLMCSAGCHEDISKPGKPRSINVKRMVSLLKSRQMQDRQLSQHSVSRQYLKSRHVQHPICHLPSPYMPTATLFDGHYGILGWKTQQIDIGRCINHENQPDQTNRQEKSYHMRLVGISICSEQTDSHWTSINTTTLLVVSKHFAECLLSYKQTKSCCFKTSAGISPHHLSTSLVYQQDHFKTLADIHVDTSDSNRLIIEPSWSCLTTSPHLTLRQKVTAHRASLSSRW